MRVRTVEFLEHTFYSAGAAAARHCDIEVVGVLGHDWWRLLVPGRDTELV